MAGYIGSKAVSLSTTGADIAGDADVSGALDVGGAFTSQGIDDNATSTAMTLDASGNVGIGVVDPDSAIEVQSSASGINSAHLSNTNSTGYGVKFVGGGNTSTRYIADFRDYSGASKVRLDGSGNLLVGKTSSDASVSGMQLDQSGEMVLTRTGGCFIANRIGSDGGLLTFRRENSNVGSIGTNGGLFISNSTGNAGLKFWAGAAIVPCNADGSYSDNDQDLGYPTVRFDDIYATNGTIQTSDRNEKQDIAELSDAEQRVAVAAKGLLRKFRWRDAVEAKGDDARTHFGIIAQDLQAAFAAEGLDAGDYAMFISSTWWEHDVEVPAVEAVAEVTETTTDEDGNEVVTVVTEAVEAVDAYTRTDTYDTQEEAPEGATERTRLGVRYSELLAFIIGAL
jgi:hypothetical protein